jgi:hypothetical protein
MAVFGFRSSRLLERAPTGARRTTLCIILGVFAGWADESAAQGLQSERELQEQQRAALGTGAGSEFRRTVVLTPAVSPRLTISGADDRAMMTMGLNNAVSGRRSELLNDRMADPAFDAAAVLMGALLSELKSQRPESPPLELPVARPAGARLGALSRDAFPVQEVANLLRAGGAPTNTGTPPAYVLDIAVHELGLRDSGALNGGLRPTVYATYRILGADGSIVQLTKSVLLNSNGPRRLGTYDQGYAPPLPEDALGADPSCRFPKLPEMPDDIARLRRCMNEALVRVALRIAADPILGASDTRTNTTLR